MTVFRNNFWSAPSLVDGRTLLTRVGFRFLWCTILYLAVVLTLGSREGEAIWSHPLSSWILAVPIAGGLIDGFRLLQRKLE